MYGSNVRISFQFEKPGARDFDYPEMVKEAGKVIY